MSVKPLSPRTAHHYDLYVIRWQDAGLPDPEAWLDTLTPANAKQARAALRHHFPDLVLRNRQEMRRAPKALTHAELDRCRLACHTPLVRATLDGLYYTAARVEEFLRLRPENIRGGVVYLPVTKTGNLERPVPLHPSMDLSIFPHPYGTSWALQNFRAVGDRAGVHLYPRLMRATAATHMLQAGVDVRTVQEILGHVNLATTMKYLAVTDEKKVSAIAVLG